jgi:acetylornithine deacetylase/succinyl-diaminopimelate desuccinylase-like protein
VKAVVFGLAGLLAAPVFAAQGSQTIPQRIEILAKQARVRAVLERLQADDAATLAEQREIAEIPSPPFKEAKRAEDFQRRLKALGLPDVTIDREGNVVALRRGTRSGRAPTLVLSAHLDTVFPEGTDVRVKERDGKLYGPGLADDARGLAALLSIARTLQALRVETVGDLLLVGTVGEEGAGDLRGVKALVRDHPGMDGFISIDGVSPDTITSRATASRRWRIIFKGPGGHSFVDFGRPSAIHAMGRAIAAIDELRPPPMPRTTFTVGVVTGGTSVNAIAAEASMDVDIRSDGAAELTALETKIMDAVKASAAAESARWLKGIVTAEAKLTGERPGGDTGDAAAITQVALAASRIGGPIPKLVNSSTDSNVPIAAGIPAITLRGGGDGGNFHSLDEWYRPVTAWIGTQRIALTVLGLVGVEGVAAPILEDRR